MLPFWIYYIWCVVTYWDTTIEKTTKLLVGKRVDGTRSLSRKKKFSFRTIAEVKCVMDCCRCLLPLFCVFLCACGGRFVLGCTPSGFFGATSLLYNTNTNLLLVLSSIHFNGGRLCVVQSTNGRRLPLIVCVCVFCHCRFQIRVWCAYSVESCVCVFSVCVCVMDFQSSSFFF